MVETVSLRLLLIEDDLDTASLIQETLEDHFPGARVWHSETLAQVEQVGVDQIDLVLTDMNLPDGTGLQVLHKLLVRRPDLPVVLVTGEGILENAVEAIRRGAYDYIVKAGDYLFAIPLVVEKNLEIWRTKQENLRLQAQLTRTLDQVRMKNHELEEAVHELKTMAATDPLTSLANRRAFGHALEQSFAECSRYDHDLACIMIDLDGFKQLNDTLGHQRGDELLQFAARLLEGYCRRCDVAARFGGDEFIVLLPETNIETARSVAERIQTQYRAVMSGLGSGGKVSPPLTMSMGIATLRLSRPLNPQQLISHADQALYRAKEAGKTCVRIYDPRVRQHQAIGPQAVVTVSSE